MNFRKSSRDEPEINLIPFIDVLLVVLIFLMLSTTYSKFTELQIKLPLADAEQQRDYPKEVIVAVSSDGRYMINKTLVEGRSIESLGAALVLAAKAGKDSVVIISADASSTHQSVITVMEAARRYGFTQIPSPPKALRKPGHGKPWSARAIGLPASGANVVWPPVCSGRCPSFMRLCSVCTSGFTSQVCLKLNTSACRSSWWATWWRAERARHRW